jgi:site-specific recombinase XerD
MVTETASVADEMVAFDDYLRYGTDEELSKGPRTRRAYLYTVGVFRNFLDGREPIPELAKTFIKSLEEKGNGASSINRHIWALKSYFRYLIEKTGDKKLEFKIRGLRTQAPLPRYLKDKEWDKLLDVATAPIYDPALPDAARRRAKKELALLYAYCGAGLRLSEALNLAIDDIIEEGFFRVTRKGGHQDFVPVEDEVIRVFKEYLEAKGQNGQYVFSGKEPETPMAPRTAQGIIKALCRRAGLEDVHVHSLRHTAGYQLRKGGAPERDIQDFLGHQNIATTKIYTHLANEDLKRRLPRRFARARQGRLDWK